jgi:hypothetical protein
MRSSTCSVDDQITEDKMGGACSLYVGDEKCIQNFGWKVLKKEALRRQRHRLEDNSDVYLREVGLECVDWTHVAQNGDWWLAVVNMVMNLHVLYEREVSRLATGLLTSQKDSSVWS